MCVTLRRLTHQSITPELSLEHQIISDLELSHFPNNMTSLTFHSRWVFKSTIFKRCIKEKGIVQQVSDAPYTETVKIWYGADAALPGRTYVLPHGSYEMSIDVWRTVIPSLRWESRHASVASPPEIAALMSPSVRTGTKRIICVKKPVAGRNGARTTSTYTPISPGFMEVYSLLQRRETRKSNWASQSAQSINLLI